MLKNRIIQAGKDHIEFPDNRIKNTKYTLFNFVPKNLFEQLGQFYNLYFLIIALLQLNSELTPVNPISTWLPLLFVFALSALKEAYDDLKRARLDQQANEKLVSVVKEGFPTLIQSEEIRVGNIIFLQRDDDIPCDMVLLATSESDGTCYIQTTNLDGESDLKSRKAANRKMGAEEAKRFAGVVECSTPNDQIYSFEGRLQPEHMSTWISLDENNLLLQGTHLRNTAWVYGVAVYTGNETKIGKNKNFVRVKRPRVDLMTHRLSICVFLFQLMLTFIFGIIGDLWYQSKATHHWYLHAEPLNEGSSWQQFKKVVTIPLRFLLLNSLMIPISLKVTLDLVKHLYAKFIEWDINLYDADSDTTATASSAAVCEDLGQIQLIFSDKTGTLTENLMTFSRCSIGDEIYIVSVSGVTDYLHQAVLSENNQVIQFLISMALCHTVKAVYEENELIYEAASPDEEALVKAAAARDVVFFHSDFEMIEVRVKEKSQKYQRLDLLPFSSVRKRMSWILKDSQGQHFLLVKGADDVILPRLSSPPSQTLINHLSDFAGQGLRTLCFARRFLSKQEVQEWQKLHAEASNSMDDRQEKILKCYDMMENHLEMMGVTAIEDKLQQHVPEAIQTLKDAGIRVWMMTGDRSDTAVQTAMNCNLLTVDDRICYLEGNDQETIRRSLLSIQNESGCSLVILGNQIDFVVAVPEFVSICTTHLSGLICARTSPNQKAKMVEIFKEAKFVTLAIGDGGNDVAMIQKADVGVAIYGREGRQASRAADYSLSRFSFICRLLLVHGRYAFYRTSFVTQFSFYKSMFICFIQILYQFLTGFSGTTFFNTFCLTFFNVLYTSAPVAFFALDKDVPEDTLIAKPWLYCETQLGRPFTAKTFLMWLFRAGFQALVVYLLTVFLIGSASILGPFPIDYSTMPMIAYTTLVIVVTLTVLMESKAVTILNHAAIWGSLVVYFISMLILDAIPSSKQSSVMSLLFSNSNFWFLVILETTVSLAPFVLLYALRNNHSQSSYSPLNSDEFKDYISIRRSGSLQIPPDQSDSPDPTPLTQYSFGTITARSPKQKHLLLIDDE